MNAGLILFGALVGLPGSILEPADARPVVAEAAPGQEGAAQASEAKPKPDGSRLVKVALLADQAALHPGETCTLAVKLTIEPKWHIYWQNPGDAGVPTKVSIQAPPGFEVGDVRFPAPEREESEGDIVSYVHTGEVALLVDVKAPKDLAPGTKVEFGVEGSWLVCTAVCLLGKGEARLSMTAAGNSEPRRLAHETEFKAWRAKLPRPYEDLLAIAGFHASEFGEKNTFELSVPGALALDFYPNVDDPITLDLETLELARTEDGCRMKLGFAPPAGYEGPQYGFRGIVVVHTAKGVEHYSTGFGYTRGGAPKK